MKQTINTCDYCKEEIHSTVYKLKLSDGHEFDLLGPPPYLSTITIEQPYLEADLCLRCATEFNNELSKKIGKGRVANA